METVAETSEEFMDRYFSGDEFTEAEIFDALKTSVADCSLMPVAVGCGPQLQGIAKLLEDIVHYLPAPSERTISGVNMKTGDAFEANYDCGKDKSAFVFKSIVDPFIGKYSFIKVASGVLTSDDTLYGSIIESEFRCSKLYVFEGSKPVEVKELRAGDIGALAKLDVVTGETISTKAVPIRFEMEAFSKPYTYKRYLAKNKGDDDKISSALAKLLVAVSQLLTPMVLYQECLRM